jgi:opacity protein-like surface antigen
MWAAACVVAGTLLATSAVAQDSDYDEPLRGNIGVHAGFAKAQDAEDGNFLGGVHLELTPVPVLGIQGAVDYRSDERFDVQFLGTNSELNVRTIPVTVSARVYAPLAPRFQPFGVVGAGWYHQIFDYSSDLEALGLEDTDENTFGWHVGLGASALFAPRIGVFAEARWVFLDPDRAIDDDTVEQVEDFDFDSSHWMAGLNFYF